nr:immunoglobulin light chain junction region [Macaca mulatta]MOX52291.1 immunoglobulin light chain junction region [Macaca mulatta]
CQQYNTWNSF